MESDKVYPGYCCHLRAVLNTCRTDKSPRDQGWSRSCPRDLCEEFDKSLVVVPKRWSLTRHLPSGLTETPRRIVGF